MLCPTATARVLPTSGGLSWKRDAGALVAGLEFALGRRAVITGKPSPVVFREAVSELRADIAAAGGAPLRNAEVAMVGDDPQADVAAARRVGLRGFLVLTGKTATREEIPARLGIDAVAASLAEIVAAMDGPRRRASN